MSIAIKNVSFDGFQAITAGVDSGRSPAMLDRSQLAWAINATMRDGFITCRPGWSQLALTFLGANGVTIDTAVRTAFQTGRFQGASSYLADDGLSYLVTLIGGRVFLVDCQTLNVQELETGDGVTNNPNAERAWFCQAENYLIIQNASDSALIYDGATLRRSAYTSGVKEVPPGSVMAYNNGRLWVASPDGTRFVAGDLVYSVTGSRADVLGFTENTYLNGGGFFSIPSQAGPITAMRSVAVQDNPTGQGPLIIFTTRGAFSVNAPYNRDDWQNTTSPIVTIALQAAGATAQDSTALVNGDIWFRSPDGIRSFVYAQRDHGTWVNTPLSREMSRALDNDTAGMLQFGSAILFDNRLLCTTQPYQVNVSNVTRGIAHRAFAVLDFSPVSLMFNRAQPAWEGVWTGLPILKAIVTDSIPARAFIFALDADNAICLWELSRSDRFDNDDVRIAWSLETPSYGFDSGGWNLREIRFADLWSSRIAGVVDFTATFREDGYPFWRSWHTWQICASIEDCIDTCDTPQNAAEQYRARTRLPSPPQSCDTIAGKPSNLCYRFQTRIAVEGHAQIRQFRIVAVDVPEDVEGGCP